MGLIALRAVIDHPKSSSSAGHCSQTIPRSVATPRVVRDRARGVLATQDPNAAAEGDGRCGRLCSAANLRPAEAIEDMTATCRAADVVSCSVVPLVYPDAVDTVLTEALRRACQEAGCRSSTRAKRSGFANDILPLAPCRSVPDIDSIRSPRCSTTALSRQDGGIRILGFGQAPGFQGARAMPGVSPFGGRCCINWRCPGFEVSVSLKTWTVW